MMRLWKVLLLLVIFARLEKVSAGAGRHAATPVKPIENPPDETETEDTSTSFVGAPANTIPKFLDPLAAFGHAIVLGQQIDYRKILHQGGTGDLVLVTLLQPSRIIRSTLLGWIVSHSLDRWGYFQRRSFSTKYKRNIGNSKKQYRRRTTEYHTTKTITKGVLTEPPTPEDLEFEKRRSAGNRQATPTPSAKKDAFDRLIPEGQQSTNLLSKEDRERIVEGYSYEKPKPRPKLKKPYMTKRRRKNRKNNFWTRQTKFAVAWAVGHWLSPLLWLTPVGGWTAVLCIGAELVQRIDKLEDSNYELVQFVEPFRADVVKAVLMGSVVGATTLL